MHVPLCCREVVLCSRSCSCCATVAAEESTAEQQQHRATYRQPLHCQTGPLQGMCDNQVCTTHHTQRTQVRVTKAQCCTVVGVKSQSVQLGSTHSMLRGVAAATSAGGAKPGPWCRYTLGLLTIQERSVLLPDFVLLIDKALLLFIWVVIVHVDLCCVFSYCALLWCRVLGQLTTGGTNATLTGPLTCADAAVELVCAG
jgi:hypothetical protein